MNFKIGDVVKFKCKVYSRCKNPDKNSNCNIGIFSEIIDTVGGNRYFFKDIKCYGYEKELRQATEREEFLYKIYGAKFGSDSQLPPTEVGGL